jgi:CHRD domain
MKRLALAAVTILVFGVAGCGSSNNPNAPSDITIFTVQLSALNENPPITNAEATARGTAVITINKATNKIDFNVSLNSFPAGSAVNIAHIHGPATPSTNASVVVSTGLAAGQVVLTNGSGTFSFQQVDATAALIAQILAAPQTFYFNAHTTLNPGGAVRGMLQ